MSTTETAATPKAQRRRRSSTGGFKQKLDAPQRKGYVRRWVDNDPSRIQHMQEEMGYTLVAEKAGEGESRTDGLGTRIDRHAGTRADGQPQRLVLMECRQEDYDLGVQDKEDALKPFEEALRSGQDTQQRMTDAYATRDRSSIAHNQSG